jgi:hypothetical protein
MFSVRTVTKKIPDPFISPLGYVEGLNDARTKLAVIFSILPPP